jgi:hypothetical protein
MAGERDKLPAGSGAGCEETGATTLGGMAAPSLLPSTFFTASNAKVRAVESKWLHACFTSVWP